jgi:translation elongation factor EF-G
VTNTSYAIDEDSLHDTEKQVVTLSRKIQTCENHIVSCKNSGQRVLLQNKVDRITTNLMLAVKVLKLNKGCTDERIEVLLELGRAKVRV